MPLNIGLIGAGRMGKTVAHHLAFAVDSAKLVAIAATRSLDEARPVTIAEVGG
jgi:predicted homoserine dehydrogenase-like protein